MTINEAITVLCKARTLMGGDRCLILSLTDSEIEDADVDSFTIQHDPPSGYVEVRVKHPSLLIKRKR